MTTLHHSAFEYLKPTEVQQNLMSYARTQASSYAQWLENNLNDGPDKTYALRKLREVAMWVNVAITRQADGAPRP